MARGMAALDAGKAAFCGKAAALGRGNGMRTSALFKSFTARAQCLSHHLDLHTECTNTRHRGDTATLFKRVPWYAAPPIGTSAHTALLFKDAPLTCSCTHLLQPKKLLLC